MKKIDIGSVYTAHGYSDGKRIDGYGWFYFKILEKGYDSNRHPMYLGIKLDMDDYGDYNSLQPKQLFWFDRFGVYDYKDNMSSEYDLRFKLQRKIKKKEIRISNHYFAQEKPYSSWSEFKFQEAKR